MHLLINTIVLITLVLASLFSGCEVANALGGSLVLIPLLFFIIYASNYYKTYKIELSVSEIIILSIILFNFLDYLDRINKLPFIWLVILFSVLAIATIASFIFLGIRPLSLIFENGFSAMKNRIYHRLALFPLLALFIFCIPSSFIWFHLGIADNQNIDKNTIRYIPISVFWLTTSFCVTFVTLTRIKKSIIFLTKKNLEIKSKNYNMLFFIGLIIIVILGSGMEFVRGAWFLWTETALFFVIIFSSLWLIWRFVFPTNKRYDILKDEVALSSLTDIKPMIIIILLYSLLATIYLAGFEIFMFRLFGDLR